MSGVSLLHNLIAGHEPEYPMLARALTNVDFARNPLVEWTVETGPSYMDDRVETWKNYCEIIQTPFDAGSSWDKAIRAHLRAIDDALSTGTGERKILGVRTLLGRAPTTADEITLLFLRDTQIQLNVQAPGTPAKNRLLSELSVRVRPHDTPKGVVALSS